MIITIIVLIFLFSLVLIPLAFYGFFKKVVFTIEEEGGEILVYENMLGDYKNSGEIMDKIYFSLNEEYKIHSTKGFGIYYDNPQEIEKSKLRSEIGCIIEEVGIEKIVEIEKKFRVKTFPKAKYLRTEFPYKNKLSVFVALLKIYPAFHRFLTKKKLEKGGFIMEIYDMPNKKIIYRKKL
jgi:hypothetical protein